LDTLVLLASTAVAASIVLIAAGLRTLTTAESGRISWRVQRSGRVALRPASTADVRRQEKRRSVLNSLERPIHSFGWSQAVREDLRRAEINLHVSEYILIRAVLAVTGAALVLVLFGLTVLSIAGAIAAPIVLWLLPPAFVARRVQRRQRMIDAQLDGALVSIASGIRAGFSFLQACQVATNQMQWPLRNEFEESLEETGLGVPIEDALTNMAQRVRSYELDIVVNAVMVHRAVGGNLADVLDSVAGTIRERRELRGHLMALTAQQRLSAFFVAGVPVFMAAFLSLTSWEFMKPLWTTTTGNVLLVIGIVLDVLGFLVMRRLTRIDF
jgi:tight adherence protein B